MTRRLTEDVGACFHDVSGFDDLLSACQDPKDDMKKMCKDRPKLSWEILSQIVILEWAKDEAVKHLLFILLT